MAIGYGRRIGSRRFGKQVVGDDNDRVYISHVRVNASALKRVHACVKIFVSLFLRLPTIHRYHSNSMPLPTKQNIIDEQVSVEPFLVQRNTDAVVAG